MLQRRLARQSLDEDVTFSELPVREASLGSSDWADQYRFVRNSMQHGFFVKPAASREERRVFVLHTGAAPPLSMDADTVIARMFGSRRGEDFEIWHLSVNKAHPRNDSLGGVRWGVYGLRLDDHGPHPRWVSEEGQVVTRGNSERLVRGSPNPYATHCLYLAMRALRCSVVRQNEASPCAMLFAPRTDHTSHPATQLVYRALGFERMHGLDAYAWERSTMIDLEATWTRFLYFRQCGLPVVHTSGGQRRPPEGAVRFVKLAGCRLPPTTRRSRARR